MKKYIFLLILMVVGAEARDLDTAIEETTTYNQIHHDNFYGFDGTNWTATAKLISSNGMVRRVDAEFHNRELVTKLVENTSLRQADVEEVVGWLKYSIEQVVEEGLDD